MNFSLSSCNASVPAQIVRNVLHSAGLKARTPRKKPYISEVNRKRRLEFAMKYKNEPMDFWERTERVNRDLLQMIASCINDNHETWDPFLREFAYALRTTVQVTLGKTPAELFLGRKLVTPFQKLVMVSDGTEFTIINRRDASPRGTSRVQWRTIPGASPTQTAVETPGSLKAGAGAEERTMEPSKSRMNSRQQKLQESNGKPANGRTTSLEVHVGDFNDRRNHYCQVIYSQFGLAIHQNDHQARRRFVEWAQNEIAVVPDFHKRILFSDEAHFWLNGYVNKQNCRIWSEANSQVNVETRLHLEKLTVWCALWAGGILLQKR
ncbi:uncharacterized protein TNCV_4208361 [Trichonephila clavipes]|nr:uncharacterized protein TNCV_4208361 [Trichonephila clavipes]